MLELNPRLAASETLVPGTLRDVALGLPCIPFSGKTFPVGDALVQARASQHGKLYPGLFTDSAVSKKCLLEEVRQPGIEDAQVLGAGDAVSLILEC